MKKAAIPFSFAAVLCCLMVCNTVEFAVDVVMDGLVKRVEIECEAQARSIREQLQIQIGAIMASEAAAAGEPEAGTYVLPMPAPFLPKMNPNQSAE
jgi:hypothetical protein